MKKFILLLTCFFISMGLSMAQTTPITGIVIDETGEPVIGASVIAKGTNAGTVTDTEGRFSLNIPSESKTVVVSYVGMKDKEVQVSPKMRISLSSATTDLKEVVVTAMGLKRSEKSLGYAATTVKSDNINAAVPVSVMSGLTGKVAGVNISTSGGTGTSQKVLIRGVSSFTDNSPLYVVDGIPIQNSFMGNGGYNSNNGATSPGLNQATDFGNQAGDINPEDIESVTVLKGASATALYGSRAANGVILINTKRGVMDSKIKVAYTGTITTSDILRTPQTQNMFGQGWPLWDAAENGSWGPRLDGQMRPWGAPLTNGIYDPKNGVRREKPFGYVENNIRDFYDTGMEYINNVSLSAGGKNTAFVMSYNNVTSDGVVPGDADKYIRNTFSFRGNATYNKLSASFDANYVRKNINQARGGQGGSSGATTFQELMQNPVDISYSRDLKDYNNPYNNVDNYYTWYAQNPYWVINNNTSNYQDDRVYGKIELSYDIIKGLKAVGRLGGDFTNSRTKSQAAIMKPSEGSWNYGHKTAVPGNYEEYNQRLEQIDATAFLNGDYAIGQDFRVTGTAGWNLNTLSTYYIDGYLGALNVPDWYSFENGSSLPNTVSRITDKRLLAAFGQFDGSYKDWLFAGVSLRNDWSSTLPTTDNSYFYWGIYASGILTEAIPSLNNDILSYLKVRGSWGQTGNDAPLYRTNSYFQSVKINLGFGNLFMPLNGISGLTEYNTIPNTTLKPEITTETEFGIDARFFKNRLNIDFAWYNKNTKNQIISAQLASETGYTSYTRNIGLINNKGIELQISGIPVKLKDFEWELGATFYKNVSEVKELWEGATKNGYTIRTAYDISFRALVGEPLGVFQVPAIQTVSDRESPYYGKTIVGANGLPLISSDEFTTLGGSSPDFTMGFNTRLTYKGISLGTVFDWRKGGVFYSNTARMLDWNGNGINTLFNERQPFLVPNSVKVLSNGSYAENDIPLMTTSGVLNYWNYSSANKGLESNAVISRSYFKVREITLSYALPKQLFSRTSITGVEVSLIGRNLFMWTGANNRYVDPEISNYGNDLDSELGEFSASPSLRNIGGSVKVTF